MEYPMELFRVVIAGGRHFNDYPMLAKFMDNILREKVLTHRILIVSGKARGADSLGERYAQERGYTVQEHKADWDGLGKSAGYRRNEDMAKNSDATVAFWDGKSVGTKHMINLTKQYGNKVAVCNY